jgi:hypothetical protein
MPIEVMLLLALHVGVIALLLIVFQVLLFGAAEKFSNLLRRHSARGIRLQIEGRGRILRQRERTSREQEN